LALETWFLNKPEVAGIGLPSYIGCWFIEIDTYTYLYETVT
jgi:hypothetical protein